MSARKMAEELILKFKSSQSEEGYNDVRDFHSAARCALIAAYQIMEEIIEIDSQMSESGLLNKNLIYWQEVKNEIENYDT
jgi:hypothetical protein